MEVKRNKMTNGIYCVFEKEGNFYLADLSFTWDHGYECMIFNCDENGKVKSWSEVFVRHYNDISEKNLLDSVETFLSW